MLKFTNKKINHTLNKGFTLVEMAIVIAIIGLLVGGALSFYKPLDQNIRTTETKDHMARVANALSSYALRNNRVPCPADPAAASEPFGSERGSGATGVNVGSCTAAETEGIVPYRTLGLRQEDVIDGYGSYLSYRVSPAFTNNNNGSDTVHDSCRTAIWMNASNDNINPEKARFCCPNPSSFGVATDIIVSDASGNVLPSARTNDTGNVDSVENSPSGSSLAIVYTLVSHGPNRHGKYLIGSTTPTDRYAVSATVGDGYGTGEDENQDEDINFVDNVEVLAETTAYYDDLILWRTQDSVLSELGTNTCAAP